MTSMKKRLRIEVILAIIIALTAWTSWAEEHYHAKVVSIADGDMITVLHNNTQIKIRLYGIDTPEKGRAFGTKAKQFTADQIFGKSVLVTPMDTDRYGLTVALIDLQNDTGTLNEALVDVGLAWVYRKYCKADFYTDWLTVEEVARFPGHGRWTDPYPIPPYEYRRE